MKSNQIDVFILSGFLGSGKSTLLANLLEYEKQQNRKIGVIMNEMGQVSIDSELVPNETPLKELLNGCICCNLQGELSLQLKMLVEEHDLNAIYIESTGAAHLIEVLDACTHPTLIGHLEVKSIITLVNAKQWKEGKMSIKLKKLLKEQVRFANIVILNKLDTVEDSEVQILIDNIREINSSGCIIPSTYAVIDPGILKSSKVPTNKNSDMRSKNDHAHLDLKTFSFTLKRPISRIEFEAWLTNISGQLYRAKGFVKLIETPGIFLFNYSYGVTMFERCRLDKEYEPILVFIGENLDKNELERGLLKLNSL